MYKTLKDQIRDQPLTDKNIILDIDETLVYSHEEINQLVKLGLFSKPEFIGLRERVYLLRFPDKKDNIWGITRPHTEDFLIFCFSYFKKVIVWSAGTEDYVKKVVDHLFKDIRKPDLVYTREDCVIAKVDGKDKPTLKPLKKIMEKENWLNLNENNTFFLDDYHLTFTDNPQNAIHIPKFNFEENNKVRLTDKTIIKEDDSLQELIEWFLQPDIRKASDIKTLDKKIFSKKATR